MYTNQSQRTCYALAALLGVIGGAMLVAIGTRAIPKMMVGMMSSIVQNIMAQIKEGGCDPSEMFQRMIEGVGHGGEK